MSQESIESKVERPHFTIDNRIYVSAGIILYTRKDGQELFLLQQYYDQVTSKWIWEDFGGKSEASDKSIMDVAIRECLEELNSDITYDFLSSCIHDKRSIIHKIPESKYMLHVAYIDETYVEYFSDYGRWLDLLQLKDFIKKKLLHPRIQNKMADVINRVARIWK